MASAFLYTNCTITNSTLNIVGGGGIILRKETL